MMTTPRRGKKRGDSSLAFLYLCVLKERENVNNYFSIFKKKLRISQLLSSSLSLCMRNSL